MSTRTKSLRRNVLPATACAGGSTTTSGSQQDVAGSGVRFQVTVAGATATGTADSLFLCVIPAAGGAAVPLVGFSAANQLSVNGMYFADFYPGAWLPATVAAGGKLLGAAGTHVPLSWAVQVVMGAGNSATITIDAVMLP